MRLRRKYVLAVAVLDSDSCFEKHLSAAHIHLVDNKDSAVQSFADTGMFSYE